MGKEKKHGKNLEKLQKFQEESLNWELLTLEMKFNLNLLNLRKKMRKWKKKQKVLLLLLADTVVVYIGLIDVQNMYQKKKKLVQHVLGVMFYHKEEEEVLIKVNLKGKLLHFVSVIFLKIVQMMI